MIIDEAHVIEELTPQSVRSMRDDSGVRLRRNTLDPDVITDGVDVIQVVKNSEEIYQVNYWGYATGRLLVTPDGVEELGEDYLKSSQRVPRWMVDPDTVDSESLPWWIPSTVDIESSVECDLCHTDSLSVNSFIPDRKALPDDVDVVCQDCWDRRVPYLDSEIATQDCIVDDTPIDIFVKIESQLVLDTGSILYSVRDLAGCRFDLKIWAAESDSYDMEIGHWYFLEDALGDTYDDPMIDSNHGQMNTESITQIDVTQLNGYHTNRTKENVKDETEVDIIANVEQVAKFDEGSLRCGLTDTNGEKFEMKIWADEASQYDLQADQWYYFVLARGDTYDETILHSNHGAMVDIPLGNIEQVLTNY